MSTLSRFNLAERKKNEKVFLSVIRRGEERRGEETKTDWMLARRERQSAVDL